MTDCIDHLNFLDKTCPDCGLAVNNYGNTEAQPCDYCSFPDCGCDGARLCDAGEASDDALTSNIEGMWRQETQEQKDAVRELVLALDLWHRVMDK